MTAAVSLKSQVEAFWNTASCGESAYAKGKSVATQMAAQAAARYSLEPCILSLLDFSPQDKVVLEIGVGMGADHLVIASGSPKRLVGVDLTERAINITRGRLAMHGLPSDLQQADAESLPFPDGSFDVVYSCGVLHHTPDTPKAFREVARVLKPGGSARILIYHSRSIVGLMLWLRYGIWRGLSLKETYSRYLESPGTKAYTVDEAAQLCRQAGLEPNSIKIELSSGDLLEGAAGQRHTGALLSIARAVWPRWFIRAFAKGYGLSLLIDARKA